MRILLLSLLLAFGLSSCHEETPTPKPRGYYRLTFPEHKYKLFQPDGCPYSFEVPEYAVMIKDTNSLSEPWWYYMIFPGFNGQIYLTYRPVKGDLEKTIEDTRSLVYKHTSRASSIDETLLMFPPHSSGILYLIGGDAASPEQFFVTDSTTHFLRGAMYFNAIPNADSIGPVVKFLHEDVQHMLKTLRWTN